MIPQFETPWLMITGGDIVLPGGDVMLDGTILVNQGLIQDIVDTPPSSMMLGSSDVTIIDATGHWVTPGLIDQHLHGAFGVDFNQSSLEEIQQLLTHLPSYGITGLIPTIMTAPKLDMAVSLSNLEEALHTLKPHHARIFGIHLEGPFLNPQYRGAHPPEDLLTPTLENLDGLLSPSLKRMTIAPELDKDFAVLRHLVENEVLCSLGHSSADYDTVIQAARLGAVCATHLFNAMGRFTHREPGIVLASLLEDDLYVELIADGVHLAPQTIQLALRTKPFEKTILISDCNALTGMPPGTSRTFGKQVITRTEDGATNQEGRLAGSTRLLTDCVRNIAQWGVLDFPDAVQLATRHPAEHLGIAPLFGQIAFGAMADLVLWEKETLDIVSVLLGGEIVSFEEERDTSAIS